MGRWLPINGEGCIDMREGIELKEAESVWILGGLEVKHYISCICDIFFLFCIYSPFPEITVGYSLLAHNTNSFFFAVVADQCSWANDFDWYGCQSW